MPDLYKSNLHDLQRLWTCSECERLTLRDGKKDNTPLPSLNETTMSVDEQSNNESVILGETLHATSSPKNSNTTDIPNPSTITLEQMKKLLAANTEFILQEMTKIKFSLRKELSDVITNFKDEILGQTNSLRVEQDKISKQIEQMNKKILCLENDKCQLQNEIKLLQQQKSNPSEQYPDIDLPKKIVLYGFEESYNETERELLQTVCQSFHDYMELDLNPFIENIRRIGRRGRNRPILLELISKRMARYVIQHAHYFKNSGIYISEFKNKTELQEIKQLRELMSKARQEGKHAIIRENKLYIEGKLQDLQQHTANNHTNNQENNQHKRNLNSSSFRLNL